MRATGKPTINDVARVAGVSKKTVSRVINKSPQLSEKTRLQVEQAIAELGFVPNLQARAFALRRNFIIAVIHGNPNAQFLVNVQQGVLEGIADTEFGMMVQPVDRNSPTTIEDIRDFLERQRPYGVLLLPPLSEREDVAELCRASGCRFVRMGSVKLDAAEHSVISNDREAVHEAVSHLIEKGHRRIALIEGPPGFTSPQERRAGFEEAMAKAGIGVDKALIKPGGYTFESGTKAGEELVRMAEPPTAIFACNDEMAIGAMIAARRNGLRIPEDLSIVGFDDTPLSSHVWPSLTTVHWPIVDMARLAAGKLIGSSEDAETADWLLPCTFKERGSVVPPKQD